MLPGSDPYKILQVDSEAELEVIRAAYRALALKYHPDLSAASQERMTALNQAWATLRDPASRASLDQALAETRRAPAPPGPAVSDEVRASTAPVPTGAPSGTVLDFGRYAGWSLGQLASADPNYLEWLARTSIGRSYQTEIAALLAASEAARRPARFSATATARRPRGRFRRG